MAELLPLNRVVKSQAGVGHSYVSMQTQVCRQSYETCYEIIQGLDDFLLRYAAEGQCYDWSYMDQGQHVTEAEGCK